MTGCLAAVGGALHPEPLFSFVQSVTFIFPLSLISSFSSPFRGHALILYRRVRLGNEVWIRHVRLVTRLWERGLQMVITDNCDLTMMLMVQTVWLWVWFFPARAALCFADVCSIYTPARNFRFSLYMCFCTSQKNKAFFKKTNSHYHI